MFITLPLHSSQALLAHLATAAKGKAPPQVEGAGHVYSAEAHLDCFTEEALNRLKQVRTGILSSRRCVEWNQGLAGKGITLRSPVPKYSYSLLNDN